MIRTVILLVTIAAIMVGCGFTKTFSGRFEGVKDGVVIMNCSDEVNKGKKGGIDDIGYLCNIKLTADTKLLNENGKPLAIEEFPMESLVKVVLTHRVNIKKYVKGKPTDLTAEEMILLSEQES